MAIHVSRVPFEEIAPLRELHRGAMGCQIVHDSLPARGLSDCYLFRIGGQVVGYGTAKNSTFEVLGVPVLWFPWMIYPLKTERQSGLLFPEFQISGRNGFEIGLPVFLTLGDPVNLTLTPRWLRSREPWAGSANWAAVPEPPGQRIGIEAASPIQPWSARSCWR